MRRNRHHKHRCGVSLVEILLASVILVSVLVPLMGLLFSGRGGQEGESMASEAASLAANIMERLMSDSVPFEAIDPAGGKDLVPAFNGVSQAGFHAAFLPQLAGLLMDSTGPDPGGGGPSRIRSEGLRSDYYVYFFAGKYPDDPPVPDAWENSRTGNPGYTRPDFDETLTFLYHPNPAARGVPYNFVPADQEFNRQLIVRSEGTSTSEPASAVPYRLLPHRVEQRLTIQLRNVVPTLGYYHHAPDNISLIPGWPRLPARLRPDLRSDEVERANWSGVVRTVVTAPAGASGIGTAPTMAYHPRAVDQASFRLTNGAFMKMIVGVKFAPHRFRSGALGGSGSFREFWLVGFKARIKE